MDLRLKQGLPSQNTILPKIYLDMVKSNVGDTIIQFIFLKCVRKWKDLTKIFKSIISMDLRVKHGLPSQNTILPKIHLDIVKSNVGDIIIQFEDVQVWVDFDSKIEIYPQIFLPSAGVLKEPVRKCPFWTVKLLITVRF